MENDPNSVEIELNSFYIIWPTFQKVIIKLMHQNSSIPKDSKKMELKPERICRYSVGVNVKSIEKNSSGMPAGKKLKSLSQFDSKVSISKLMRIEGKIKNIPLRISNKGK